MNISPIIKVVGMDCNMRCGYCYYECPDRKNKGEVVTLSTLDRLFSFLVSNASQPKITVIWHGGEPTIVGLDYFREIMSLEATYASTFGVVFKNKIQTNGILVDDSWGEFFARYRFNVGVSIDGPKDINDAYRAAPNGESTFEQSINAVHVCQQYGVKVGCLAVTTDASIGRAQDIFDFFVLELGVGGFRLKPGYEVDQETGELYPYCVSPREYGNLLIGLFNAWIAHDDPKIDCGPVSDYLRSLLGKCPRQCFFKRNCLPFWSVWPNGDIYQCEFGANQEARIGNLHEHSDSALLSRYKSSHFVSSLKKTRRECLECKWFKYCRGGCSRYDIGMANDYNIFCLTRKMVFSHISDYLSS